ncbi:hypothetical protein BKA67DRAFT_489988, partial [Truncatella angustata]
FNLNSPQTTTAITSAALIIAISYLGKYLLDQKCPKIPILQVPKSSACRNLVESKPNESAPAIPWGTAKAGFLPSWSGSKNTHWTSTFTAIQIEVPVELLAGYRSTQTGGKDLDTQDLVQNFLAAFLDARANGLDGWLLDRCVPPLSFEPGSHLFGTEGGLVAYMLGSWSSSKKIPFIPSALPVDAVEPVSHFPSNERIIEESLDAAGAIFYWKCPTAITRAIDKVASYGCPWRLMEGGYQEFIVERLSGDTARVTYVTVECSSLHPRNQVNESYKIMPRLFYEAHVLYAQTLINRTVRQLRR